MKKEVRMFEMKPVSQAAREAALEKAERYRLLNEPVEAESICLDVLRMDPENQEVLLMLLLALTDQFPFRLCDAYTDACNVLERLQDDFARVYYEGVICERRGKAHLREGSLGAGPVAHEWFRKAMGCYERAEALRPEGNDDPILRWNSCARYIMRHKEVQPPEAQPEQMLE